MNLVSVWSRAGRRRGWRAFALAWLLLFAGRAHAHVMPFSVVMLDFGHDAVGADLILPLQELELGFKQPLLADPAGVVLRYGPALRQYLLAHIHPTAPDGQPWTVEVVSLSVKPDEQTPDLRAHVMLRPPAGEPLRRFTLHYDVIVHEVISHKTFVFVRNDWNDARFRPADQVPPMPEAVGLIRYLVYAVPIDRTHGSFWRGFGTVMQLGMLHISAGLDHLLFLFVLLLPAPLLAVGRRWGGYRGLKPSFLQLFKIVTAFTIGHSLTLVLGAFGLLRLPARPVEILVAISILVSAIHAIRPWFAGWEAWVAGGFGLVHGLSFASSLAAFGFTPWHLAMTILGFNLGVELMQLVVVALVPTLILLSRQGRAYLPVRIVGATLAGLAALVWIGARMDFWLPGPAAPKTTAAHHASTRPQPGI